MDTKRHARKCKICSHPEREEIEQAYLSWTPPDVIVKEFNISYPATLYLHVNAVGLAAERRRHMNAALDPILEKAHDIRPTVRDILEAIKISSQMDERGVYLTPTRRTEITHIHPNGRIKS